MARTRTLSTIIENHPVQNLVSPSLRRVRSEPRTKYVPPALRKGAKYQSFRKGTAMGASQRTKFRQGDYVFYKNSEARVAKVKAGYDGEPNLYQIRWQGQLVDKVPEPEISLKMLEHDELSADLMAQEIPSPQPSSDGGDSYLAEPAEEAPRSKSLRGLQRPGGPKTIQRSRSARGIRPSLKKGKPFGGSFRSLSLADEDPGSIRGSKRQADEVVWGTGDSSIVYDHTRVKSMQNIRRATPQNSGRGIRTDSGRGIIMRSEPGLRQPKKLSARNLFNSARGVSSRTTSASTSGDDERPMRGQRGLRKARQASKFKVEPPASASTSGSPKAFDMDALKRMVDLRTKTAPKDAKN